jgi:hypothetical protein
MKDFRIFRPNIQDFFHHNLKLLVQILTVLKKLFTIFSPYKDFEVNYSLIRISEGGGGVFL